MANPNDPAPFDLAAFDDAFDALSQRHELGRFAGSHRDQGKLLAIAAAARGYVTDRSSDHLTALTAALAALASPDAPAPSESDAALPSANDVRGIMKPPGPTNSGGADLRASVIGAVLDLVAREIPCGQAPEAASDHPCKKTWAPYKQACPECPLHHADRGDFAATIADAVLPLVLSAMNLPAAAGAPATVVLPLAHQIEAVGLILGLHRITGADNVHAAAERLAAYLPEAHRPKMPKVPTAIEYAKAIDEHRAAAIDLANLGPQAHESRRVTARTRYYASVQALHAAAAIARAKAGLPEPQWVDRLIAEADARHRESGLHSSFYQGVANTLRQYRAPAPGGPEPNATAAPEPSQ